MPIENLPKSDFRITNPKLHKLYVVGAQEELKLYDEFISRLSDLSRVNASIVAGRIWQERAALLQSDAAYQEAFWRIAADDLLVRDPEPGDEESATGDSPIKIVQAEVPSTVRTGGLVGLTILGITDRLGFAPSPRSKDGKCEVTWKFTADGIPCAIWDYKGSFNRGMFSTYGPAAVFERLFGAEHVEDEG